MRPPIKIAFAEDHQTVRQHTIHFLESTGRVEVTLEANNGLVMLDKLRNTISLPELLLIDRSMPEMDGITLLQRVKETWPRLHCMMLSAHTAEITIKNALHAGAGSYISKIHDNQEVLLDAIIHTACLGHYFSSQVNQDLFHAAKNSHKPRVLTDLELRYCHLLVQGLTNEAIALRLGCHIKSVESTARRCFGKMGVTHRTALMVALIKQGIVNIPDT